MLLQGKQIRLPAGHIIPSPEELGRKAYCKWHNSFSHSTNDCNVFRRQVQSAISEGRLTFTEASKMKLDSDPFPVNMIEFQNKKMLIRSDQAESAKEKNVVEDNAPPRMIKPKNPEIGVWKVNGKKKQAPRPKPTVSMLLEKYTSRRTNNMFNRLGGVKRPRSPPRPNNEQWERNPYEQQPGFPMQPAYWGCPPPIPPHFPPWGFNHWAPFPMGPPIYFQPRWDQPSPMYQEQHGKRIRFGSMKI
jgi:hypothetical protein